MTTRRDENDADAEGTQAQTAAHKAEAKELSDRDKAKQTAREEAAEEAKGRIQIGGGPDSEVG